MLEEAILEAKAGGRRDELQRDEFSPTITVDVPVMIPEEYVPDLDLRMGLYRRINELDSAEQIEGFAAELIDRFGKLPPPTENLIRLIEIKLNAKKACVSKIETGPRGAVVTFHNDAPPDVPALLGYVQKIGASAKLRPDSKLVISRDWENPKQRLNGALQLSRGLAKLAT
jgi:transcription-repair coupling factor (superfamily II helicase)